MKTLQLALTLSALTIAAPFAARAATETYDVDPVHTWVGFSVRHVFTQVPGFFSKVKGSFTVDRDNLENSRVESVIDVSSITTTSSLRDEHLRSDRFFDVAKYPTLSFTSRTWKRTGDATFAVTGDLTIRDIKKEVLLTVKSLGFGPGMQNTPISGWELSTRVDRRDFGMAGAQGPIGNEVNILIHVEAGLRPPQP